MLVNGREGESLVNLKEKKEDKDLQLKGSVATWCGLSQQFYCTVFSVHCTLIHEFRLLFSIYSISIYTRVRYSLQKTLEPQSSL